MMTHAQDVAATPASRGKRLALVLIACALVLGLVATGGSLAYAKQFEGKALPGTSVLGLDVSNKTAEDIVVLLEDVSSDATVTVNAGSVSKETSLTELGARIDAPATAERAVSHDASMGTLVANALRGSSVIEPVVTVDPSAVRAFAQHVLPADDAAAQDAAVVKDENTQEFSVVPARDGQGIDADDLIAQVEANASAYESFTVELELTNISPSLSTEEAEAALAQVEQMTETSIVVHAPKDRTFDITANDRLHFLNVAPNDAGDDFEVTLDQSAFDDYMQSMANEVEVTKKDGVVEVHPDGSRTETSKKQDGVTITNKDAVKEQVATAIREGHDLTVSFETTIEEASIEEKTIEKAKAAAQSGGSSASLPSYAPAEAYNGEKWIDVDLTKKTLTAYVGDKVVFGPRLIVDGKPGYETVEGYNRIYLRNFKQDLTNANFYPKGHPKYYYTPDVPYVQYFLRGYAIHGAPWRSTFGHDGSHGCVNMTVADAEWMWNWAEMGTMVVTHRS